MERVVRRIAEYISYLYHRPWEWWELLALGMIVSALLLVFVRTRQKSRSKRREELTPSEQLRQFRDL